MKPYDELLDELVKRSKDIKVKAVDISSYTFKENRGYRFAILLYIPLDPDYIYAQLDQSSVEYGEFCDKERFTDETAEWTAEFIAQHGYKAFAQSERNLTDTFDKSTKTSVFPHKTVAVLSGIGWIGKNNLLVTKEYGSAISMCTVLTNMPCTVAVSQRAVSDCMSCRICTDICPPKVLHNTLWESGTSRDDIVNIYQCKECLQCLINCKWTRLYAMKYSNQCNT